MKQFLIFLIGFISILVALAGAICAVCAFIENGFTIVCGVLFLPVWAYAVIWWFKSDMPEVLYDKLFVSYIMKDKQEKK